MYCWTNRQNWTATLIKWEVSIFGIPWVAEDELSQDVNSGLSGRQFVFYTWEVHVFGRLQWFRSPSNTKSPGPRPTSIPSGILVHLAIWPQRTWAENWGGAVPF